jgi:hypothetical protein
MDERDWLTTRPAFVNGAVGAVTTLDGEPFAVGAFTVKRGRSSRSTGSPTRAAPAALDLTIPDD